MKALLNETWIGRTLFYEAWMKIKVSTIKNSMTMQITYVITHVLGYYINQLF